MASTSSASRSWNVGTDVGSTALLMAAGRAIEADRPDALVIDPYAASFVNAAHAGLPTTMAEVAVNPATAPAWLDVTDLIAVRTRVFDDFFERAGLRQAVIVAAGLDSRAARLAWPPGAEVYEIDQATVLRFKKSVLQELGVNSSCVNRLVSADLRDNWMAAVVEAGFSPGIPTAWLLEGLMPYLDVEVAKDLILKIRRLSASGSCIAVEWVSDMRRALTETVVASSGATLGVDVPALVPAKETTWDLEPVMAGSGWRVSSVVAQEAAKELGRVLRDTSPLRFMSFVFGTIQHR